MAFDDKDDDEEEELQAPDSASLKNSAPDISDPREKLKSYLLSKMQQRQVLDDPQYRALGRQSREALASQADINALGASLSHAASQAGSVGGQTAQSSVQKLPAQFSANNQAFQQGLDQEQADQDKRYGVDSKVYEYLADKKAKQDQLAQSQKNFDTTQDFKNKQLAEQSQLRRDLSKDRMMAAGDRSDSGSDKKTDDAFRKLGHDLTGGLASSRSDFGQNQRTVTNADKVLTLADQGMQNDRGLTKAQMHEFAISVAGLVSGSATGAAQSTIEALVPHTYASSAAGIEQWLSNEPTGTNQKAFIKQMSETADREKFLANEKIKGIKSEVLQSYSDLADKNPQKYQKLQSMHLGEDAQLDKFGRYVPQKYKTSSPPETAPAVGGSDVAVGGSAAAVGKMDPAITNYATQHGVPYNQAKSILVGRGYKPNE